MLSTGFLRRRATTALLLVAPCLAAAQDVVDEIDEIVVTADFRERSAARVPASVTVIGRQGIERGAIQHFEELILSIPNLNWSGDGNRARYLQIRGVGELEQYEGAPNPSVGFLIDDIDFSGIGSVATLFDLQSIEVLRGPQGSRYGANALAGLVYAQSTEPGDEWSTDLRVSAADDSMFAGGVALGGPVAEGSATKFRASIHRHDSDGFRDNAFLGRSDTNGRTETTARGKLVWEAAGDWYFRLAGLYTNIDDGYDAFALDNSLTVLSDKPGNDAQESIGASFKAEAGLGNGMTFTSITAYADSDIDFSFDADWGNDQSWSPFVYDFVSASARQRETVSQELRIASAIGDGPQWLLGVYAQRLQEDLSTSNQGIYEDDQVYDISDTLDVQFASRFESLNLAAFGQLVLPIGDMGEVTVGLRGEHRATDYADSDGLSLRPGETMFGGELAYSRALGETTIGYVSLSRGYKAGGFNLGIVPDGRREFGAESLWNLEAGFKSRWLADSLIANAAVFYNERKEQQVRTSFQLNPNDPASFVFFTDNAARGETFGLEADLRWIPADVLELFASLGLLDARFDSFATPEVDLSGRDQAHAPGYSATLGMVVRHPNGPFARIEAMARDAYYFDVSHDQRSSSYELVNLRLGYESDRWTVQLWARNLFDESYAVRGFFFGNQPPDFPAALYVRRGDPRQLGLTLDMHF